LEIINPALVVSQSTAQENPSTLSYGWLWWGTWYERQNMRDDRAEAFISLLWDGVYEYTIKYQHHDTRHVRYPIS
jgi:hypothetical protein